MADTSSTLLFDDSMISSMRSSRRPISARNPSISRRCALCPPDTHQRHHDAISADAARVTHRLWRVRRGAWLALRLTASRSRPCTSPVPPWSPTRPVSPPTATAPASQSAANVVPNKVAHPTSCSLPMSCMARSSSPRCRPSWAAISSCDACRSFTIASCNLCHGQEHERQTGPVTSLRLLGAFAFHLEGRRVLS